MWSAVLPSLALGTVLVPAVMAVVWTLAVRIRNAGIVDIAWSLNFSLLALLYATLAAGFLPRRLLIAGLTVLWSLRLGGYLY
jgi:steroid 5-alpha reductase family enzyme